MAKALTYTGPALTRTGFPTGLSKIAPEFRDASFAVLACGDNLDAPTFIGTGGAFFAPMCREALPAVAYSR